MGDKLERFFIPALVGLAPFIFALVTWKAGTLSVPQNILLYSAGPVFVTELCVIAFALREGMVRFIRDDPIPRLATAAIVAWVAVGAGTSLLAAPGEGIAVRWTLHWIVHLLFGFSLAYLCLRQVRIRDLVVFYLVGFLLFTCVFVVFAVTYWNQPIDWVRLLPGAMHIRHVGIFAAAMTGMSIGALTAARSRASAFAVFATTVIGFTLGVWTGSRGMVLSVVGATIAGAILIPAMRKVKIMGAAAVALAAAVSIASWIPVPNDFMMGVSRAVEATTEREVTTGRVEIWTNVIHAIGRQPLFGYGPGQMPIVAPYGTMGQPHNLILQILLDWGFAGMACVLIVAFFYLRRALPAVHREGQRLAAPFMAMMSLLLLSMIDAAMFHVLPVSIFAACAGMLASAWWGKGQAG